jgi:hypothetical protein
MSNERLVRMRDGQVAFRVRDNAHAGKKRRARLPAPRCIGRVLQHVLPPGCKRSRHDGLLAASTSTRSGHAVGKRCRCPHRSRP